MNYNSRIGFMQGRLSPVIDGKIQAFPWLHWQEEFEIASKHGFELMEWTLDQEDLYKNPFMTAAGHGEIRRLSETFGLRIPSLTGDCFMQAPFYKSPDADGLKRDFIAVCKNASELGVEYVCMPLVDNGRLETPEQENQLVEFLLTQRNELDRLNISIVFESDFPPRELARFIEKLPAGRFGINYDIGNSAALGFSPTEEFDAYGGRIQNVHIKDRQLGGGTVPLGQGSADFSTVFRLLSEINYEGNYILQTARAEEGQHAEVLDSFRAFSLDFLVQRHR